MFCVTALLALGMVILYSSGMFSKDQGQPVARYLVMQLLWCAVGLLFCVAACLLDYRWLRKMAWPLFTISVVLLALVLVPHIGTKTNGARRWLTYHKLGFQPSELAKLSLIFVLAWYGERFQRHMSGWKRGVLVPALFIGLVLGLVFVEPDRGTTVLIACVSGAMLLIAGVRWRFILPPVLAAIVALAVSLQLDPVRSKRITSWFDGTGYQARQAMLALGSGGWTGVGLGNGPQKLGGFVPEHHTDFIFCVIGEELGLVATLLVIAAYVAIVLCGFFIALRAPDTFGRLIAVGITCLIGLQALINIGVVTSTLPNKGLPLPFVSYGGSNLLAMLTSVGLLLSIARYASPSDSVEEPKEQKLAPSSNRNPFRAARSETRFARSATLSFLRFERSPFELLSPGENPLRRQLT